MYDWISPNLIIPVHGEFRHLNNRQILPKKKCGIKKQIVVENGSVVLLKKETLEYLIK